MSCPSPEIVAAMAEGRLSEADRDAFLDHAAGCDDCRHSALILAAPKVTTAKFVPRRATRPWIPWAAAAAVVLSIAGLLFLTTTPAPEKETVRVSPKVSPTPESPKQPAPIETPKPPDPKPEPTPEPIKPPAPKPVEPEPVKPV